MIMKNIAITLVGLITIILGSCNNIKCEKQESNNSKTENQLIFSKGEKISNSNFTGNAWLNSLIESDSLNQNAVGSVTFEPEARTNWHSHPAGQIILALEGIGYYQEEGKPIETIQKGDVVKCPQNVLHWHGATPNSEFIQIAITGRENGETLWSKPVTDEEYYSYKK